MGSDSGTGMSVTILRKGVSTPGTGLGTKLYSLDMTLRSSILRHLTGGGKRDAGRSVFVPMDPAVANYIRPVPGRSLIGREVNGSYYLLDSSERIPMDRPMPGKS